MDRRDWVGMALGLVWALAVLAVGALVVRLPVFALVPTVMTAFLAPGLVLAAMLGRVAQRRFSEAAPGDGGPLAGAAGIDRRVLADSVGQLVLALCVWPAAAVMLGAAGPGVIVALGLGFALARVAFWAGCHRAPALAAFGFAASFCPTVLVALWTLARVLT